MYAVEAEVEGAHWWYIVRRRLLACELHRMGIAPSARVLDIGTSTGANLSLLAGMGCTDITGLDSSPEAVRFCESRGVGRAVLGAAEALPFPDGSFDFVLATDVLEHLEDDVAGVREILRVLRKGGKALITVPASPSLWGPHDAMNRHYRRYRMPRLRSALGRGGLVVDDAYHFNYLLFPPIWLARFLIRRLGITVANETKLNAPLLNRVLETVFELDARTAPLLHPPFGVSILAKAYKP